MGKQDVVLQRVRRSSHILDLHIGAGFSAPALRGELISEKELLKWEKEVSAP